MKNSVKTIITLTVIFIGLLLAVNVSAVTPTTSEVAKLVASDDSGVWAGHSVSVDGSTALMGAPRKVENGSETGAVYLFVRDAVGNWSEHGKLLASDGAVGDYFGISVSVAGDTALIGAQRHDVNGTDSGAAYVFVRDETGTWREQAKLIPSGGGTDRERFGSSVAMSGDTAVIGAYGSAYLFVRDAMGNWSEQAQLVSNGGNGYGYEGFGRSVAINIETTIIGEFGNTNENGYGAGAAYVFVRDETGTWLEQAKLIASDGAANDYFGMSVSVAGDTALIGAERNDENGTDSGAAYVFVRDETGTWREQAKLFASDDAGVRFSRNVALSEDTALVGAPWESRNGYATGASYLFVRDEIGTWREQAKLVASDGRGLQYFGDGLAISGNTLVVGTGAGGGHGAAYVFDLAAFAPLSDIDDDQIPDIDDPCPNDSTNTCDPAKSGAEVIDTSTGGSVTTQDGSVTMDIPAGALSEDTTLSITHTGTDYELTTNLGVALAVFGVDIQPEGTTFATPVTLVFRWDDVNNVGRVDGTNIKEDNLRITKDNVAITGKCKDDTGCDPVANTFSITVTSLSVFGVIGPLDSDGDGVPDNFDGIIDACVDEDATGFDVDNDGCIDSFSGLVDLVAKLVNEEVISTTMQNSLLSKVSNAEKSVSKDNVCTAINELEAFKNQVDAQTGKKISVEAATQVKAYADSVDLYLLSQLSSGESCNI